MGPLIWSHLSRIADESPALPLTMATVFFGGLAGTIVACRGGPHPISVGATALELIGMPILLAWHRQVIRTAGTSAAAK